MPDPSRRPNILLILDDQHRFDFLGCAGADWVRTPNLDRLAARGVRFRHCTSNAPVCAPARIGLATGIDPWRLGSLDNASFLPLSTPTCYQRLRDHGYRVGCVGKLDLAKPDHYNGRYGDRPVAFAWGFTHPEECEGKMHAGSSPTPVGPYTCWLAERDLLQNFHEDYELRKSRGWIRGASHDSVLPADAFEDAYIGRRAAEWIDAVPDDFPWHYFVSFVGPHDPFDPPTEYADRYRNAPVPEPVPATLERKPRWIRDRSGDEMTPEEIAVARRQYCGSIELIDDQVGIILDALERRGMLENTFVLFSSDHGEMLGDMGLWTKSVAYEPSLHVPLIAAGPGIAPGRASDALVELDDINPTVCELAGLPPQENIDARSFAPVLRGETEEHRDETCARLRNFECVRTRTHKLIMNHNDEPELYDLENDPRELHSIAPENPELVGELRRRSRDRQLQGQWLR
jgi:choline-sulfatase